MAEANHILADAELRARMGAAVMTVARRRATTRVKEQFRARGSKVAHMSHREIVVAAEEYGLCKAYNLRTARQSLRRRHFSCANVMHEMDGQRALKGQSALKVGPRYVCGVWCVGMEANGAGEMIIAYARVSTDGQTLDAQHATLKAAGLSGCLLRRPAAR